MARGERQERSNRDQKEDPERIEKLVGINLILPVTLRDFGKVRQCATVQFDAFLDQFPTDSGNDLFAPGIKQSRVGDTPSSGGTTQLKASFDQ